MRIVVIEDHLMFRDVIWKACTSRFGHEVVGQTESGAAGVEMVGRLRPDAVILDLTLPDMDGFEVVRSIFENMPSTRILVVSSYCDDYTLFRVEKSGVHGFVDKNSNTVETLREALMALQMGKIFFSAAFQDAKRARRFDPKSFTKILSNRERDVLSVVGKGLNDKEIGALLDLSFRTVQTHRSRMLRKLGIKGTPKLIAFAIEHGFTRVSSKFGLIRKCS